MNLFLDKFNQRGVVTLGITMVILNTEWFFSSLENDRKIWENFQKFDFTINKNVQHIFVNPNEKTKQKTEQSDIKSFI